MDWTQIFRDNLNCYALSIFRVFILFASSDSDKHMLMRQLKSVNKDSPIDYLFKKVNKRLYALRILKKSGVPVDDLVKIFCALIRSVLEYTSPVWAALPDP